MEGHIPVVPNLNQKRKVVKKQSVYDESDPDVFHVLRKNIDISDIETQRTQEELTTTKENSSFSWLVIALVIVVIILLIAVVYLVLSKNDSTPVPENVVKPNMLKQQFSNQQNIPPNPNGLRYTQEHQKENDQSSKCVDDVRVNVGPSVEELDQIIESANNSKMRGELSQEEKEENYMKEEIFLNEKTKSIIFDEDEDIETGDLGLEDYQAQVMQEIND